MFHVFDQTHHPDNRRRINPFAFGLVVEGDVSPGHRRGKGTAGIALAVGMTQWPYFHACGWELYGYLGAIGVTMLAAAGDIIASNIVASNMVAGTMVAGNTRAKCLILGMACSLIRRACREHPR